MSLVAQSPEVVGFERDLRNQKTAMLVVVDDGKGGWSKALDALRKDEGFLDLELELSLRSKLELIAHLQERHGLGPRPLWAVFTKGRLVGSGHDAPTLSALRDLKEKTAWQGREDILRNFLRNNPDQREVHLQLLSVLYQKAALRTQIVLKLRMNPLRESDQGWDAQRAAKESEEAAERKRKEEEEGKPPKQLEPDEDERIWGTFSAEWQRSFQADEWRDWEWTGFLAEYMRHSPRMQELYRKAVPEIEATLRQWPNRYYYWQIWLQANEMLGGLSLRRVLDTLVPGPMAAPEDWPPYTLRREYVKDCRRRKDWAAIKDLLLSQWERERLWKSREKSRFATIQDGKEIPTPWDASEWRESREPLVEALLMLGETVAADEIVRTLAGESLSGDLGAKASALALKCGQPALSANWSSLVSGKAH